MAVTLDATSNSGEKTSNPFSWSTHTCSGSDRAVWVLVSQRSNPAASVTGITYDGVAMGFVRRDGDTAAGQRSTTEIWSLAAPSTTVNATIQVTFDGAISDGAAGAISFNGVDQTTPNDVSGGAGAFAVSGAASQSIMTITAGAWTVAVLMLLANGAIAIQNGDTQYYDLAFGTVNGEASGSSSAAAIGSPGSKTMGWTFTSQEWALSLAAVRPVGAAASLKVGSMLAMFQ